MARKTKVRRDSRESGANYELGTERLKAWATLVTAFGSLGGLGGLAVYLGLFTPGEADKVTPPPVTTNSSAPAPAGPAPPGPQPPVNPAAVNPGGANATVQVQSTVSAPTGRSNVKCEGTVAYCRQLLAAQLNVEHPQQNTGATGSPASPRPSPVPPEPQPVPPEPPPTPPVDSDPPPSPPPACVSGPFMIFFDWDRDEITPQAEAILDNAASSYQSCGQAQVMIAGHTDRSGPDRYNIGLSQRRTENARSYLAGRGIPDGVMSTEAFGESRPLVETPDGLDEPQNRRVEITFGPGTAW